MHADIVSYHNAQAPSDQAICERLALLITAALPDAESRIWHAHPVWFLHGNPIVGYSKLKSGVRLLFWSGQSFTSEGLTKEGSFKAAEVRFTDVEQVNDTMMTQWLAESREIQWDYKNLVKRKGRLEPLTPATA